MVVDLANLYPSLKLKSNRWDRQTVVIVCDSWDRCDEIRKILHDRRRPCSSHFIRPKAIESDSFVNLNYNPINTRRPQDRNVRIVYVDGSHITAGEVYERFSDAYIIIENDATDFIEGSELLDSDARKYWSIESRT